MIALEIDLRPEYPAMLGNSHHRYGLVAVLVSAQPESPAAYGKGRLIDPGFCQKGD
jgi:hypothetical protein